jgi:predicted dehydrogenase
VNVQYAAPALRDTSTRDGWRLAAEQSGGGLFMDLASHPLDLLDFLLGPIAHVDGIAVNRSGATAVEDNVVMCFRFESGVVGTGAWDFASARGADVIQINGSAGRLTGSTFGRRVVVESEREPETFETSAPPHVHQPLVQTIVDELLGRGTCPSTGRSAARTAAVMDRVLDAYYGGRDDAFWTRAGTWPGRKAIS